MCKLKYTQTKTKLIMTENDEQVNLHDVYFIFLKEINCQDIYDTKALIVARLLGIFMFHSKQIPKSELHYNITLVMSVF